MKLVSYGLHVKVTLYAANVVKKPHADMISDYVAVVLLTASRAQAKYGNNTH